MVRKYIRKSQRKSWSPDAMRMAIEAVIKQGCSIRKASIENEVPHATLSRKIHQCRIDPEKQLELITNPKGSNFQTVFSKEQENILCQYINTLESQCIGLSGMDIRRLAFQVAEKYKLPHRFNKCVETAGEDWYRGFLKRNPNISVKKSDNITEKSQEVNREKVHKFFNLLESKIDNYRLEASDVYAVDATVITCLLKPECKSETLAFSEESESLKKSQSKLVTAVMCISASGVYTPLMLISPCKSKMKIIKDEQPQEWMQYDPSGQMKLSIFTKWLKKFIQFSNADKNSPVLLILDDYRSYLKNLQVLDIAKDNGVHIICLPSHCTDKLHPMHYNFMKTLSTSYSNEIVKWSYLNSDQPITVDEVFQLFKSTFTKVSSTVSPVNGFRYTGIWPVDRNMFEENIISPKEESTSVNTSATSELFKSVVEEACQEIILTGISDDKLPSAMFGSTAHEPIVVITQNSSQPFVLQSIETINDQDAQFIQQYQFIKEKTIQSEDNVAIDNDAVINNCQENNQENDDISSIVIPPEAQLSEANVDNLHSLIKSQRQLYFYVSPYKLNL